jgi:Na+/proline symporter
MNYVIFTVIIGVIFAGIYNLGRSTDSSTSLNEEKPEGKIQINNTMEQNINTIRKWVSFFGWLTIINLVVAFIYVLSIV